MRQSLRAFCLTCLGTYACKEVGGRASERWTDMHPPAVAVRSQLVRKSEVQRVDLLPENFQRALLESDAPDGPRFHWEPRDGARVQAAREPLQQRHEIREVLKVPEQRPHLRTPLVVCTVPPQPDAVERQIELS